VIRHRCVITPKLVGFLRERFSLDWRGIHGAPHWARVRHAGLLLAEKTDADATIFELFSVMHDLCRKHDGGDHEHGHRSADLVDEIHDTRLGIGREQSELLAFACRHHSDGLTDADVTVQTCWDADRLDLGRVGIRPHPSRLCTAAARDPALIDWAWWRSLKRG
jgi:uncharacterized protein